MYICVRILFVVLIMYIVCCLIIIDYQRFIKNMVFSANFFLYNYFVLSEMFFYICNWKHD